MCARFLTMKQLREEHEEWFRPSEVVMTKKNLTSTKRELLERIRELEAENADLKRELKVADRAIINTHNELKAAMERY